MLLWDVAHHTRVASLRAGTHNGVDSVAFSPDGRTLAAGTFGGTVLLWDAAHHIRLASLSAGTNDIGTVAFSPDGRTLAAAGIFSSTVRLLPVELLWRNFAALRSETCAVVTGGLTPTAWRTYAPNISYRDPCL